LAKAGRQPSRLQAVLNIRCTEPMQRWCVARLPLDGKPDALTQQFSRALRRNARAAALAKKLKQIANEP